MRPTTMLLVSLALLTTTQPLEIVQAQEVPAASEVVLAGGSEALIQPAKAPPRTNPYTVTPIPARDTGGQVQASGLDTESLPPSATEQSVTAEIAALQSAIGSATDLTEEVKSECVTRLDKSKQWLQGSRQKISEREQAENEIAAVPSRIDDIRKQLSGVVELPNPEVPKDATVAFLESRLDEMRQQSVQAETAATAAQTATDTRTARLTQIAKETQDIETRIQDEKKRIDGATGDDLPARTIRLEQQARLLSLQEQVPALQAQRNLLDATSELMPLQRDLAVRKATAAKKQLHRWEEAVTAWRQDESKRQAEQARRIVEQAHPALRSFAVRNVEIAELRIASADGIGRIAKSMNEIDKLSVQLAGQFEDLRGKVEHAGATTSTGILLRKQRGDLPNEKTFTKRAELVAKEMPAAHLRLMELKQLFREVADVDEAVANVMQSLNPDLQKFDSDKVQLIVKRLLSDRRQLLDKAIPDQDTYLKKLNELDLANKSFEQLVEQMRSFLDQRVLWMRSNETLGVANLVQAANGLANLLSPSRWKEVVRVCMGDFLRRPAASAMFVTLFVFAIMFRANLLSRQRRLCDLPQHGEPINFLHSLAAFGLTFVVSVRWPLLLTAIGYREQFAADATPWTKAVGGALYTTILFVWGLELISELSSREGIGERLFGWSSAVTSSIRGTVETSLLIGTPLFAILQLTKWQETPQMENLQRVTFIALLLLVGLQIAWLLRPSGKWMTALCEQASDALVYRLRRPIWVFCSAAPLAFAGLSVGGYHFSAYQLSGRLAENAAAIVAVIVLYSLAFSWVKSNAYNREVRQGLIDQETSKGEDATLREDGDVQDEQAIHAAASQETHDLLRYAAIIGLACGGWFIWSDVLPALRIFDQVELWQNLQTVSETVVGSDGVGKVETFERSVPTTLTSLLVALVICIGTFVVSRRLPGLLELTVLGRLPLDQGSRQAIAILVRYTATLTGILFACNAIHLSWESVQWLAAAMTVGLGFGLQEIFANLVSGLIILFERPIRAGDLVTVDDVTGNVTRMQMRATTITDFDRREFIVPNKRFITDNVINWTLSDPISRVILPVGVAYGTDVDQIHGILMRIARREPMVLREPAPVTMFKGFGTSTLDFELRVFIAKRDFYVDVVNRINGAISREFAKEKVEIAFPQLDLHIIGDPAANALAISSVDSTVRVDPEHPVAVAAPVSSLQPRRASPRRSNIGA